MGQVTAEEILPRNPAEDRWEPLIVCRLHNSHETRRSAARYLTPWADYQAEQKLRKAEAAEDYTRLQKVVETIGEGAELDSSVRRRFLMIKLTEPAAERILGRCGAKPLPENRRPSKAGSKAEQIRMSKLLGQRVRRALGVGYSGGWMASCLYHHTDNPRYRAMIYIYPHQAETVIAALGGQNPVAQSALAELL